jgi:hypothetical protein
LSRNLAEEWEKHTNANLCGCGPSAKAGLVPDVPENSNDEFLIHIE